MEVRFEAFPSDIISFLNELAARSITNLLEWRGSSCSSPSSSSWIPLTTSFVGLFTVPPPSLTASALIDPIQASISSAPSKTSKRDAAVFFAGPLNAILDKKEPFRSGNKPPSGPALRQTCNTQGLPGMTSLANAMEADVSGSVFSGHRS